MTRGTGERLYRACQRCRKRKSKCDLNSVGEFGRPPCLECFRTGHDCTLAGSRRGGDFTYLRKRKSGNRLRSNDSVYAAHPDILGNVDQSMPSNENNEPICAELQNPSDALQILAKAAIYDDAPFHESIRSPGSSIPDYGDKVNFSTNFPLFGRLGALTAESRDNRASTPGINDYELVANGTLQPETIINLLQHYLLNYHSFVPLVPHHIFSLSNIDEVAVKEPFLLTAILTISSRDDSNLDNIHTQCWTYMKQLLLDVLLGLPSVQNVGSVEGLLLLSDWVPYIGLDGSHTTNSEHGKINLTEDSTAWSLVGQAVRQAYLLRLDRTSFRDESYQESKEQLDRKRLVWTFVYLADRQISVRMGQSFWSRGPSLSTRFTTNDFPSLKPQIDGEDDHASILQATIELTQLLHNVHDILYSSKTRTIEMMRIGDYSRYLDDFLKALTAWYQQWGGLKISPKLKCALSLMYDYLDLYVNAFSFQAIISRESISSSKIASKSTLSRRLPNSTIFPRGIMASPDGRFVFEAIRAAKMVLKVIAEMDAVRDLRYMPSRFYLYGIYSAVFLYRADIFGALTMKEERDEIVKLVRGFMSALEAAATCEYHIGFRYSRLLKVLWFPDLVQAMVNCQQQTGSHASPFDLPNSVQLPAQEASTAGEGLMVENSRNPHLEISDPFAAEVLNFDPFCGSFSNFEPDIFGMLSQGDIEFSLLAGNSKPTG